LCFAVNPFKAVYAYTPSKLPSSAAVRINPQPAEETADDSQETVIKPVPTISSVSATEAGPVESLAPSVSNDEGIGTMGVYSCRGSEGVDGSEASVVEANGAATACMTQTGIRRSCSLDGVVLACRWRSDYTDDDDASERGAAPYRTTKDCSASTTGSDWHSQGDNQ